MRDPTVGTAVVELNVARRADVFAPLSEEDLDPVPMAAAVVPSDLVEFVTEVHYQSGTSEGAITVQGPRSLIDLGPMERAVVAYACTLYATGKADANGTISFSLYQLARWIGQGRPNAAKYDRLERAVAAVAAVRFVRWTDRIEPVEHHTRTGKVRVHAERVMVTSVFGIVDEADLETREQIAARRRKLRLARTPRAWCACA